MITGPGAALFRQLLGVREGIDHAGPVEGIDTFFFEADVADNRELIGRGNAPVLFDQARPAAAAHQFLCGESADLAEFAAAEGIFELINGLQENALQFFVKKSGGHQVPA